MSFGKPHLLLVLSFHAGNPLSSLSSHSVRPSVLFCTWFFHSFALCSVCGSVLFWLNLKKKYHESCRLSFIWDKNEDYYSGDSNSDSSEKLPPERQEERSVLHTILAKRGM